MVFCLVVCLLQQVFVPADTVTLQTGGRYISKAERSRVNVDGTYTLLSEHRVFHFASDGTMRAQFGAKGNGPGEFNLVYDVFWTGSYFLATDSRRRDVSYFDPDGNFLKRDTVKIQNLLLFGDQGYLVLLDRIKAKEPAISLVTLTGELALQQAGPYFHDQLPEVSRFLFNFSSVLLATQGDRLYVVDEMRPDVTVYDQQGVRLSSFQAALKYYVRPQTMWDERWSRKQILRHIFAFSRIHRIGATDQGLVVVYHVPDPEDPDTTRVLMTLVGYSGETLDREPRVLKGHFLGTQGNLAHVLEEQDDFNYVVHRYRIEPAP